MRNRTVIIPCAGNYFNSNSGFVNYSSNAMLPLNGKPVISWIIDDLFSKEIYDLILVSRQDDYELNNFLDWAYSEVKIVKIENNDSGSILYSIYSGFKLLNISTTNELSILLGDTLIFDPFSESVDFIYAGYKNDKKKWCFLEVNSKSILTNSFDDISTGNGDQLVASGYYNFCNVNLFYELLKDCIKLNLRELSDVINRYNSKIPLVVKLSNSWHDLGHIEGILNSKRNLITSRSFNNLTINPILNTITKTSLNNEKLRDELNWYNLMPDELKVLSPRILSKSSTGENVTIVQEFYGYPTLSELFLYGKISKPVWAQIFRHLFILNAEFKKYSEANSKNVFNEIYVKKTEERLSTLKHQINFTEIFQHNYLIINGEKIKNIPLLLDGFMHKLQLLCGNSVSHIIHGDFCFSNILFDVNSFIIKLIDPRGSFGKKGIYGDSRYEIAKLRHSAIGKYDFIVSNLFYIEINNDVVNYKIAENENVNLVYDVFDDFVLNYGYDLDEIKLIEASLFISMLPLHADNFDRQLMLYITGILKLNELI